MKHGLLRQPVLHRFTRFALHWLGSLLCVLGTLPELAVAANATGTRNAIVVTGDTQNESITPALRYVEDAMHRHAADAHPDTLRQLPWRPADNSLLRGGTSRSQWLLRSNLHNFDDVERVRVLAVLHPTLDDVRLTFSCAGQSGQEMQARSGDMQPLSKRPLADRYPAFPVTLPANAECTAWFVVSTADTFQFPARIFDTGSYEELLRDDYRVRASGLALQLLVAVFALALLLRHRDWLAGYFALTVASQAFLILVLADIGYVLFWGETPRLQKMMAPTAIWLSWAMTGDLCLRLLPRDAVNRITARILRSSLLAAFATAVWQVADPDPSRMALLVALCAVGMLVLLAITGGAVLLGATRAGLITAGIAAISLGGILEASGFLGLLPLGNGYLIALQLGFLVSALLIGAALWRNLAAGRQGIAPGDSTSHA